MKKIYLLLTLSLCPSLVLAHGGEEYLFIVLPTVGGFAFVFASVATVYFWMRLRKQANASVLKTQSLKYFLKIFLLIILFLIISWRVFSLVGNLLA